MRSAVPEGIHWFLSTVGSQCARHSAKGWLALPLAGKSANGLAPDVPNRFVPEDEDSFLLPPSSAPAPSKPKRINSSNGQPLKSIALMPHGKMVHGAS